jgi:transcriptional regulator with XRE-family HTH domain
MKQTFDVKNKGLAMISASLLTFDVMSKVKSSADIRKEFGRWLQQQREERGINQKFIAEKIGKTETQISRIENGKSGTERDTVISWAQALNIDENEALRKFKPENQILELPEPLRISDFDGFDADDLKEIKQFLKFRKAQKQNDDALIHQD